MLKDFPLKFDVGVQAFCLHFRPLIEGRSEAGRLGGRRARTRATTGAGSAGGDGHGSAIPSRRPGLGGFRVQDPLL